MKASIRDIAREANVSITTVSRFLNNNYDAMSDSTRKRIDETIQKSGYVYKTRKKTRDKIGIITPNIINPFFAQIASELEYWASSMNFEVVIGLSHDNFETERAHVERMASGDISGIIYMSTVSTHENCYSYLKEKNVPFVVMDSYMSEYTVPAAVFVNGKQAMYEVAKHLIQNGHRNIAYISGLKYSSFDHNRYQGYTNALLEAGISVNPDLVRFSGFESASGAESFLSLYRAGVPFSAVICENDMIAFGVANECRKLGIKIPEDLSITGFDNTAISECFNPPLTSVDQHVDEQAKKTLELLQAQIKGEAIAEKYVVIGPTLILRESVKNIGISS